MRRTFWYAAMTKDERNAADGCFSTACLLTGMPKPAVIAFRWRAAHQQLPTRRRPPLDYHLGDAVAPFYDKRLFAEICHNHLYFAPVVRVNGAGSVEKADAVVLLPARSGAAPAPQSPAAARYRCRWGNELSLARCNYRIRFHRGYRSMPAACGVNILREGKVFPVRQTLYLYGYFFCHENLLTRASRNQIELQRLKKNNED